MLRLTTGTNAVLHSRGGPSSVAAELSRRCVSVRAGSPLHSPKSNVGFRVAPARAYSTASSHMQAVQSHGILPGPRFAVPLLEVPVRLEQKGFVYRVRSRTPTLRRPVARAS